ncbi:MAG: hypothetical protein QM765_34090 [Myxococcales bacterium]
MGARARRRGKLGPDVYWNGDAELEEKLGTACADLEKGAARFFGPFEAAYPAYAALFGRLVHHYADWLETTGKKLSADDFVDAGDGKLPAAFLSFKASLQEKKLLSSDLPGDLDTALWRFWNGGRPMRREDYQRDDYYDCSRCKAFISFARGRLEQMKDPVVGEHYAFVCKKH